MKCPKCSIVQADGNVECVACGIIFARLNGEPQQSAPPKPSTTIILDTDRHLMSFEEKVRIVRLCALALLGLAILGMGWAFSSAKAGIPMHGKSMMAPRSGDMSHLWGRTKLKDPFRQCTEHSLQLGMTEREAQEMCAEVHGHDPTLGAGRPE